jgi:deoxyribonuclease-4
MMALLGAHQSIAGGLHLAFDRIRQVGGASLQIFTANQRQWRTAPLTTEDIQLFQEKWLDSGMMPVASHASYLINLGTSEPQKAEKSVAAFCQELERCLQLGITFVVIHPGSHGGVGVEQGLIEVVRNLDLALARSGVLDTPLKILLETTAGQGTSLGSRFEELGWLLQQSRYPEHLGVCVDTCHIFAAGYGLRSLVEYQQTLHQLEYRIGCDHIHFFHLNDSKKGCGSRVDRHAHIGEGEIGLEGFRHLLTDPRFLNHPMTLETEKGPDLVEDVRNLQVLRSVMA